MIEIQGLCKAFDGQPVLVNWDFSLQKGEHLALMGPSGCGKTTFLRILMGLEQPDSGLIQGLDGLRLAPVFQQDRLCPGLSALANLLLVCPRPTARDRRRALELLEGLGLTETDWNKPAASFRADSADGRLWPGRCWFPPIWCCWMRPSKGWTRTPAARRWPSPPPKRRAGACWLLPTIPTRRRCWQPGWCRCPGQSGRTINRNHKKRSSFLG